MQAFNASPTWQYLQPDAVLYIPGVESVNLMKSSLPYIKTFIICVRNIF